MTHRWGDAQWRAPMAYDIYVVDDVEDLKAENARLRERVRQLVGENAELAARVDEQRRRRAYEEKDWKWLTD